MLYLRIIYQLILPHCFVMPASLYIKFLLITWSICIHSTNTLRPCHVAGTALGAGDTTVSSQAEISEQFWLEESTNKSTNHVVYQIVIHSMRKNKTKKGNEDFQPMWARCNLKSGQGRLHQDAGM